MSATDGAGSGEVPPSLSPVALPARVRDVSIVRGLLCIWDALIVCLTGVLCAAAYSAIEPSLLAGARFSDGFVPVGMRISVIAGLLAALVFRPEVVSVPRPDWRYLARQTGLEVIELFCLLLAMGFLTNSLVLVPRGWAVAWSGAIFTFTLGSRLLLPDVIHNVIPRALWRRRIVIAGDKAIADDLARSLHRSGDRHIEVVDSFYDSLESDWRDRSIPALVQYCQHHPVDLVLLALANISDKRLQCIVDEVKALDVDIALWPRLTGLGNSQPCLMHLGNVPLVLLAQRPISRRWLFIKAMEDKIVAALLLLWLMPLMVIIAISIKMDSPGPVLFRQRRHGLNNVEFEIFKFRTMAAGANNGDRLLRQTQRNDARVTHVGRFLRRSSLDELPQLLNVLRGDMSLVGPRPHPTEMRTGNRLGPEIVPDYAHRHRVKPGITGWAQVCGYRGATETAEQVRRRVEHDLFYIENWSILLDLKILALTPIKMITDHDVAF